MDKSTKATLPVYKEERFRIPSQLEKAIGLWVDRIGQRQDSAKPEKLRLLGQYAAVFIESGKGIFISQTTGQIQVNAGDAMIVFPTEPALYYPEDFWLTRWVVWNGPEAVQLEQLGYLHPEQPIFHDTYRAVSQAYMRLSEFINKEDKGAVLERKSVILHMIHMLFDTHSLHTTLRKNIYIEKVITYLTDHYTADLSIPELARQFGLSPSHFRRLFKAHTSRSPREFITALRISKAKELLAEGKRVGEVAELVGYHDVFYFMRIFKKVAGTSPGKFRVHSEHFSTFKNLE